MSVRYSIYTFLLYFMAFILPLSAQNEFNVTLLHEGETKIVYDHRIDFTSGKLLGPEDHGLVVLNAEELSIFGLSETGLYFIYEEELDFHRSLDGIINPAVTAYDIDGDSIDELLVGAKNKLSIYKWEGNHFSKKTIKFPYFIYQMTSGDITNDGQKELILACLETATFEYEDVPHPGSFRLVAASIREGVPEIFYENEEHDIIGYNILQPPGRFECIADFNNTGENCLLTTVIQSDMSPTYHKTTYWNGGSRELILKDRFMIPGILRSGAEKKSFIIGDLIPVLFNKKTYFLAKSWDRERGFKPELYIIQKKNNKYSYGKLLELPWDRDSNHRKSIVLTNSKETGILLLNYKRVSGPSNMYYQHYMFGQKKD